ncbi:MAG: GAF domain-containing protein [Acidimicrobiia bacterium]
MTAEEFPSATAPLDDSVSERVARWLEDLEFVLTRLAGAETPEAIAQTVVESLIPAVGAHGGSLFRFDPLTRELKAVVIHGYPSPVVEGFSTVSLDQSSPLADAIVGGRPVFLTGKEDWTRRYPHLSDVIDKSAVGAAFQFPLIVDQEPVGTLGLSFSDDRDFDDTERRQLAIIAGICAQAMGRALAFEELAKASARLASIDRITDVALARLPLADLLASLPARVAEAVGCEAVRIFLVEEDGRVLSERARYGIGDRPPATVPIGRGLAGSTALSGRAQVIPDISQHEVVHPAYPDHIRTVAGVPMRSDGNVVGVLDVGAGADRVFDEDDIALLELAGDRMAVAIERSRIHELERAARRRSEFMERLGGILDLGGSLPAILEGVAERGAETLAEWCILTVIGDDLQPLIVPALRDPAMAEIARQLRDEHPFDPAAEAGVAAVIRTGETEFIPVIDADRIQDVEEPGLLQLMRHLGLKSSITVPLHGSAGIVGAMQLVRTADHFSEADLTLAEELGTRIGVSVESRLSFDRHRHTARTLQESLLPYDLPEVPGVDLGARYWPASENYEVGGDFYDIVKLGPDKWGVLIGDVSGKGVEAAALTGIARHTAGAAGRHGLGPVEVLSWIHDAFLFESYSSGSYCTAIYGELRAEGDGFHFRFAVGGHPLPVLLSADGNARQIGQIGTVLGLVEPLSIHLSEAKLGPEDWLVLYTDGVTDVPVTDAVTEDEFVTLVATTCHGSAAEALTSIGHVLTTRYGHAPSRDDTAMLLIHCDGPREVHR